MIKIITAAKTRKVKIVDSQKSDGDKTPKENALKKNIHFGMQEKYFRIMSSLFLLRIYGKLISVRTLYASAKQKFPLSTFLVPIC